MLCEAVHNFVLFEVREWMTLAFALTLSGVFMIAQQS